MKIHRLSHHVSNIIKTRCISVTFKEAYTIKACLKCNIVSLWEMSLLSRVRKVLEYIRRRRTRSRWKSLWGIDLSLICYMISSTIYMVFSSKEEPDFYQIRRLSVIWLKDIQIEISFKTILVNSLWKWFKSIAQQRSIP